MPERTHLYGEDKSLLKILEDNNFESILLRAGSAQPDPWVNASSYATEFKKIKFIVAVNPAMLSPVYCAIKTVTFQSMFGNRISLNIVSGANKLEQEMYMDDLSITDRYSRSYEFAEIVKTLVENGKIENYNGKFYQIKFAEIRKGLNLDIVFAGSSDATINLANNLGTSHYHSMETPILYKEFKNKTKVLSGMKSTFIVEENASDAWGYANSLIKNVSDSDIEFLKKDVGTYESQNQKRQQSLHNYLKDDLEIYPNIWAGYGLLRGGGITAMVGNYQEVADLIKEFYDNGLDKLLIAATPEIYYLNNFINGVIPILKSYNIV